MKRAIGVLPVLPLLLCALTAMDAGATTLPDSCGPDHVVFGVKTEKSQGAPVAPDAGKAQVFLIENENMPIGPFMHATVRFGLDGAWVGADNGTSYFVLTVDPGVHHLCANWQSGLGAFNKDVGLTSFTAEPGKVYYFEAAVTVESRSVVDFALTSANEDEGKYRVKLAKVATSKSK